MFTLSIILLCSACKKPQPLIFNEIKNVKIAKINNGKLMLTADAHYHNPNHMKGKLTDTNLDVWLDGKKVGKINQAEMVKIPANEDFSIPLQAELSTNLLSNNWLGSIVSFLQDGKVPLNIKGDLTVKILEIPLTIPVDQTEEISLKDLL